MSIIAFGGQLANGKDVCADYICDKLNNKITSTRKLFDNEERYWRRKAFADAVKQVFMDSFGVDREFIEKWKRIPEPPEGYLKPIRQSLQFIGTGFREIKENIWVEIALRNANRTILSDARFINELNIVHKKDGLNILVYRPGYLNDDPNPSESQIKPLIEWCIETQQDGLVNHLAEGPKRPEGMQFVNYFIVNKYDTLEGLYSYLDEFLIPEIEMWQNKRVKQ